MDGMYDGPSACFGIGLTFVFRPERRKRGVWGRFLGRAGEPAHLQTNVGHLGMDRGIYHMHSERMYACVCVRDWACSPEAERFPDV